MKKETYEKIKEVESEINRDAKIEYHKRFLEITGLKVGDIVKARFNTKHGCSKTSYHGTTITDAYLKQHPNGILYLESIDELKESKNVSNGRTGRSRRDWWEYYLKIYTEDIKAIVID